MFFNVFFLPRSEIIIAFHETVLLKTTWATCLLFFLCVFFEKYFLSLLISLGIENDSHPIWDRFNSLLGNN